MKTEMVVTTYLSDGHLPAMISTFESACHHMESKDTVLFLAHLSK